MKHTPGPWKLRTTLSSRPEIIGGNRILAEVIVYEFPETKANAHLISAAPDLLEACIHSLGLLATYAPKEIETLNELRQTIAKAEGKD